jgi:hypothetical protein
MQVEQPKAHAKHDAAEGIESCIFTETRKEEESNDEVHALRVSQLGVHVGVRNCNAVQLGLPGTGAVDRAEERHRRERAMTIKAYSEILCWGWA